MNTIKQTGGHDVINYCSNWWLLIGSVMI